MAGVAGPTVNRAVKSGALRSALTPDGKKLWLEHPATLAWLLKRIGRAQKGEDGTATPLGLQFVITEGGPPPTDPFTLGANLATVPSAEVGATDSPEPRETAEPASPNAGPDSRSFAGEIPAPEDYELWELQQTAVHHFPKDLADLGAMTLRELVGKFGNLAAVREGVRALKDFADMQVKQQLAATRRRDLVDRRAVEVVFVPLVDLAFKRLIGEMPVALRQQIVARVLAGGDDLATDVEELIRRETGNILEDCKAAVLDELARMEKG